MIGSLAVGAAMTPFRMRLVVGGLLGLMLSVAANAMFLQETSNRGAWRGVVTNAPSDGTAKRQRPHTNWQRGAGNADQRDGRPNRRGLRARSTTKKGARVNKRRNESAQSPAASSARVHRAPPKTAPSSSTRPSSAAPSTMGGSNTGPAATPDRTLVRAIQRELANRGYMPGPLDGVAGALTRAAILAFEADEGLPLTAVPSQALLKRLLFGGQRRARASNAQGRARTPEAAKIITTVQAQLGVLGYLRRPPSGTLDGPTRAAIKRFEAAQGLAVTGRVSGRLVARLDRLAG